MEGKNWGVAYAFQLGKEASELEARAARLWKLRSEILDVCRPLVPFEDTAASYVPQAEPGIAEDVTATPRPSTLQEAVDAYNLDPTEGVFYAHRNDGSTKIWTGNTEPADDVASFVWPRENHEMGVADDDLTSPERRRTVEQADDALESKSARAEHSGCMCSGESGTCPGGRGATGYDG